MRLKEETKEEAVAWGLGLVGLLKGAVQIYAIEPAVEAVKARLEARELPQAEEVAVPARVIELPQVIGATAIQREEIAA